MIDHILGYAQAILSPEDFDSNQLVADAVVSDLSQIGEIAKHRVSSRLKDTDASIPWYVLADFVPSGAIGDEPYQNIEEKSCDQDKTMQERKKEPFLFLPPDEAMMIQWKKRWTYENRTHQKRLLPGRQRRMA
jgi:hypothetical protein